MRSQPNCYIKPFVPIPWITHYIPCMQKMWSRLLTTYNGDSVASWIAWVDGVPPLNKRESPLWWQTLWTSPWPPRRFHFGGSCGSSQFAHPSSPFPPFPFDQDIPSETPLRSLQFSWEVLWEEVLSLLRRGLWRLCSCARAGVFYSHSFLATTSTLGFFLLGTTPVDFVWGS